MRGLRRKQSFVLLYVCYIKCVLRKNAHFSIFIPWSSGYCTKRNYGLYILFRKSSCFLKNCFVIRKKLLTLFLRFCSKVLLLNLGIIMVSLIYLFIFTGKMCVDLSWKKLKRPFWSVISYLPSNLLENDVWH